MRKNIFYLFLLASFELIAMAAVGQAPQAIPYQAAARNSNGEIITNKAIRLRFTIHDGSLAGPVVYQEVQATGTNMLGMFSINIGQGSPQAGLFSTINWAAGAKFIETELDTTATGSAYFYLGSQQLMSVPYALNSANGVPIGTVMAYMGTTAPDGWMLCNGAAISRSVYSALFSVIGVASGSGNGTSTFNVPDLRGRFLRGVDGSAGFDPDAGSRTPNLPGGATGNNVGSLQNDGFETHSHTMTSPLFSINDAVNHLQLTITTQVSNASNYANGRTTTTNTSINTTGGNETRPVNVYVNYIIKY